MPGTNYLSTIYVSSICLSVCHLSPSFPLLSHFCLSAPPPLSQPARAHGHKLHLYEQEPISRYSQMEQRPLYFRHFLVWSHIHEKVNIHWRPLSAPVSWQHAECGHGPDQFSLSPVASSGQRKSQQTKRGQNKLRTRVGLALRSGEWSPARASEFLGLQEPVGPDMKKRRASLNASIKEGILTISCFLVSPHSSGTDSKPSIGGNRGLRWTA